MSSGADWFARRLGNPPPPRQPGLPAVSPPQASQPVLATQTPQVQQATTQEVTGQENYKALTNNIEQQTGDYPTLLKMSRHWKGGEAMRQEGNLRCPRCNSMNVFTRSNVTIMNQEGKMGHAKPRCFECGWQEGFTPGDAGNWGG